MLMVIKMVMLFLVQYADSDKNDAAVSTTTWCFYYNMLFLLQHVDGDTNGDAFLPQHVDGDKDAAVSTTSCCR